MQDKVRPHHMLNLGDNITVMEFMQYPMENSRNTYIVSLMSLRKTHGKICCQE